jgi:hypothetical protein
MPAISILGIPDGYMTVTDFAEKVGLSKNTVRKLIDRNRIESKLCREGEIVDKRPGILVIHENEKLKLPANKK